MRGARSIGLVLAIYPTTRGFGFALFEESLSPVDWGVKEVRQSNKNARCLEKIALLMDLHQPDIVVLEDTTVKGSRRSARIRRLTRAIEHLALSRSIETHRYSRRAIRMCFAQAGAATKYEVAQVIARQIAAYEPLLPPPRKIWMSEDPRMALFDAAALALTFYCHAKEG